jgi:ferredoxin-NADP reductase
MQTMKLALEAAGIDVDALMLEQEGKTGQEVQEGAAP